MKFDLLLTIDGLLEVVFDALAAIVVVLSLTYLVRGLMDSSFFLWSAVLFVVVMSIRYGIKNILGEEYPG